MFRIAGTMDPFSPFDSTAVAGAAVAWGAVASAHTAKIVSRPIGTSVSSVWAFVESFTPNAFNTVKETTSRIATVSTPVSDKTPTSIHVLARSTPHEAGEQAQLVLAHRRGHARDRPSEDSDEEDDAGSEAQRRAEGPVEVDVVSSGVGHHGAELRVGDRPRDRQKTSQRPQRKEQPWRRNALCHEVGRQEDPHPEHRPGDDRRRSEESNRADRAGGVLFVYWFRDPALR